MGPSANVVCVVVLGACSFELSATGAGDDGGGDGNVTADAGSVDADRPACPATYTNGYRLVATTQSWLASERLCEADLPGHTHLVVLDDEPERLAVAELAQALPGDAWVGIVRDPGGTAPWPWRYVTGGPATFAPFEGSEPNNMSGDQLTVVLRRSSRLLYDYGVDQLVAAVCECDHRPPVDADYDPAP